MAAIPSGRGSGGTRKAPLSRVKRGLAEAVTEAGHQAALEPRARVGGEREAPFPPKALDLGQEFFLLRAVA